MKLPQLGDMASKQFIIISLITPVITNILLSGQNEEWEFTETRTVPQTQHASWHFTYRVFTLTMWLRPS